MMTTNSVSKLTYIRPRDEVVRGFAEATDDRMIHDVIRDMKVVSVFDEHPAGFAPARVAAEGYVRLEIGDGAAGTVEGLVTDRLEEEIHRLLEPSTSTGGSRLDDPLV